MNKYNKKTIIGVLSGLGILVVIFTIFLVNKPSQNDVAKLEETVKTEQASNANETVAEKEDSVSKTAAKISTNENQKEYPASALENKLKRAAKDYSETEDAKPYFAPEEVVMLLKQYHQDVTENVNTYPEKVDGSIQVVENVLNSGTLTAVQVKFLKHYHATLTVINEELGHEKNWEQRAANYKTISVYGDQMKKIRTKYKTTIGNFDLFTQYEHQQLFS